MKAHFSSLSSFEIEEATQKAGVLLSSNVYDIVVGNSIDEFVVRIDASACRHLVHDNLKALVRLSDLFLLEIEWLLLIFLPHCISFFRLLVIPPIFSTSILRDFHPTTSPILFPKP